MHPNEAADINQERESLAEDIREQDSESNKSSIERNEEDEDKLDDSSEDEDKNKSDSEKEESDKDDYEAEKKSKRSSTSASRKSSSLAHEDEVNRKQDEKTDENKPPSDDIEAEVADNLTYEEKVRKAFVGDLDFSYPENVKIVRIFTSSTFTGTHVEPFFTLIKLCSFFKSSWTPGRKNHRAHKTDTHSFHKLWELIGTYQHGTTLTKVLQDSAKNGTPFQELELRDLTNASMSQFHSYAHNAHDSA